MLRSCIGATQKDWVSRLTTIEFAINLTQSESMEYSLFFLNTGWMLRAMIWDALSSNKYLSVKVYVQRMKLRSINSREHDVLCCGQFGLHTLLVSYSYIALFFVIVCPYCVLPQSTSLRTPAHPPYYMPCRTHNNVFNYAAYGSQVCLCTSLDVIYLTHASFAPSNCTLNHADLVASLDYYFPVGLRHMSSNMMSLIMQHIGCRSHKDEISEANICNLRSLGG